jgi:hypothetical protein
MPRGVFVAVLSYILLFSAGPTYAECRNSLPPTSERVGHWQYRTIHGKRCWFGSLKPGARARAGVTKPVPVMARSEPVRATTGFDPLPNPPVIVPMPTFPVAPPQEHDELWPKPDASFDQRFDAVRDARP